jgi:hypothetical protein
MTRHYVEGIKQNAEGYHKAECSCGWVCSDSDRAVVVIALNEHGKIVQKEERMTDYNGWKNYETWCAKLWIDNDGYAGGAESVREEAARLMKENDGDKNEAQEALAKYLEEAIDNDLDNSDAKALSVGLFADLLGRSLAVVDWYEIAEAYLEEVPNE